MCRLSNHQVYFCKEDIIYILYFYTLVTLNLPELNLLYRDNLAATFLLHG